MLSAIRRLFNSVENVRDKCMQRTLGKAIFADLHGGATQTRIIVKVAITGFDVEIWDMDGSLPAPGRHKVWSVQKGDLDYAKEQAEAAGREYSGDHSTAIEWKETS
jgi:hypothetical protein